ncbi:YHS domain-containing (seleno)protein [Pannonibacter sp.]|uniref:YHS domain-containing (seleno)protein n=1 Tax=Pannonibacter sp. TaxID=1906786 RepID=UPI003F6FD75D
MRATDWFLATVLALALGLPNIADARPAYFLADPVTGYAIGGYDPVAFFVDRRPRMGEPRLEYSWRGARWLFLNEGNKAAFERAPEVYAPQFAGCGAYGLAEGYATAGNPSIFVVIEDRLYFFHTVVNRFLFLVERETAIADAQANAAKTGCLPRN